MERAWDVKGTSARAELVQTVVSIKEIIHTPKQAGGANLGHNSANCCVRKLLRYEGNLEKNPAIRTRIGAKTKARTGVMGGKQWDYPDCEQTTAKKRTKKEKFLDEMDQVVPWQPLLDRNSLFIQKSAAKEASRPIHWQPCCGFISCSSGIRSATRPWKSP
jgi:hypothetical protein